MQQKIKIAIADDHKALAQTMSRILDNEADMEVLINVQNGQDLLDELVKIKVDVILLDLDMPILDGRKALHTIKKKYQESRKVIIFSYHDHAMFIERYIQAGANSYLAKGCDFEMLTEAIRSVHSTGRYCYDELTPEQFDNYTSKTSKEYPIIPGDVLSKTEKEIVQLLCQEKSCVEISKELNRSIRTIENHKQRIMKKIGAKNSIGIMEYAITHNLYRIKL